MGNLLFASGEPGMPPVPSGPKISRRDALAAAGATAFVLGMTELLCGGERKSGEFDLLRAKCNACPKSMQVAFIPGLYGIAYIHDGKVEVEHMKGYEDDTKYGRIPSPLAIQACGSNAALVTLKRQGHFAHAMISDKNAELDRVFPSQHALCRAGSEGNSIAYHGASCAGSSSIVFHPNTGVQSSFSFPVRAPRDLAVSQHAVAFTSHDGVEYFSIEDGKLGPAWEKQFPQSRTVALPVFDPTNSSAVGMQDGSTLIVSPDGTMEKHLPTASSQFSGFAERDKAFFSGGKTRDGKSMVELWNMRSGGKMHQQEVGGTLLGVRYDEHANGLQVITHNNGEIVMRQLG